MIESLLRPTDSLHCLLNAYLDAKTTREIAIVTRRTLDAELGSLLILNPSTARVVDVLPITKDLAVSVAQTDPLTSRMVASEPGVPPTEMWSAFLLTIEHGQDTKPFAYTIRMRDTQKLQTFAAECRRLKEIATAARPDADFLWAEVYIFDPSRRLDLRLRKQSLHKRLSPTVAGSPGDDVSDISIVQRDWIEQVAAQKASTGSLELLKIRIGTFNINGKGPSQDLYPWLLGPGSHGHVDSGSISISSLTLSPSESPSVQHRKSDSLFDEQQAFEPDMLVLGFQELDLSTEALFYATSTLKEDEWLMAIFAGLREKRVLYEKLTSRQLVGMLLIVIVKKTLIRCFTDVRSCDAGSGILGFMGNKGATAVRLEFTPKDPTIGTCRSTVLTFVNAHLAASDEMVDRRNYDFNELSGRLKFPSNGSNERTSSVGDTYSIYQSDILFWIVHLNYRLDLSDGDIRELLSSHVLGLDSIQTLLAYDQLKTAMQNNKAFTDFTEHHITHLPTYRVAMSASRDQLGYDSSRKPAWTDRILYMAPPDITVVPVAYGSHPEISISDHRPVSADFDISLSLVDQLQYKTMVSTMHRELAVFEDTKGIPKIKIEPVSIDFGKIGYKQAIRREALIQNNGDIPCVFRFVRTSVNPEHISPSWLRIEPIAGFLRPGERTTILLSAYVDNDSAAKLNICSTPRLDCTLILHTALGKDDFLTISGDYQSTCFANTLGCLARLAAPIRKRAPLELGVERSIPLELSRLINWMVLRLSNTAGVGAGLFEHPADERLCNMVRECLDTGDDFPMVRPDRDLRSLVAAFGSTLIAMLDSMLEPAMPACLQSHCLRAKDKQEALEVLLKFPMEIIAVWTKIIGLLKLVAQLDDANTNDPGRAHRLASIFAPVLLRDDPQGEHAKVSPVGKRNFILHFLI